MGKFSPNIAEIGKPLHELLGTKGARLWGSEQEWVFNELKQELTRLTVLAFYDPAARFKVFTDASSFGLGAVLSSADEWRPVAYASHFLLETKRRYAQTEKEALAVTWSCEKFLDYIFRSMFEIETNHKPLVPFLSNKHLNDLPPRVLQFRLRMVQYQSCARKVTVYC